MLKLVWRTDVHIGLRNPSSRKDDWVEAVLDKLGQVGRIARKEGATAVLDGGDFYNDKRPDANKNILQAKIARVHKDYPCPVYANVGNHDVPYGKIENLEPTALNVLFEAGIFERCYDNHEAVFEQNGIKVRVVGIPYHGTKYDLNRFASVVKRDEDYLVVMAHVLASDAGGSMFEGEDIIKYSDLLKFDGDLFCFGHWHKNQGIVEIGKGKKVVNIGSLTRGSLNEDNRDRIPACALLTFDENGFAAEEIPLVVKPADEVFRIEEKDFRKEQEAREEQLYEALHEVSLEQRVKSAISLEDKVRVMGTISDETKERVLMRLSEAYEEEEAGKNVDGSKRRVSGT
jgi:DNA repair exonuclease SbcCD nuclease subunit